MGATQSGPANRSFIFIGTFSHGKSTLANLLLGGGVDTPFKIHKTNEPSCCTEWSQQSDVSIKSTLIYGDKFPEEDIHIQVIDQPGLGDPKYSLEKYSKFLIDCMKKSSAEVSTTFLVTIKISSPELDRKTVSGLFDLSYLMAKYNYNFFNNAMIVFTHIDEIPLKEGAVLNKDTLDKIVTDLAQNEQWNQLTELLQRVENRYMCVDARKREPGYREEILQTLFEISKPTVKAVFHGTPDFTSQDIHTLLRDNTNEISHPKCLLKCTFYDDNPVDPLNSFLCRAKQMNNGISVIVLLISLYRDLSEQSLRAISALPAEYELGGEKETEFWKYTFIVFKIQEYQEEPKVYIQKKLEQFARIRELYEKSWKRYTWVSEDMTRDQCVSKVFEIFKVIKQCNEGREYIDTQVVRRMEKEIEGIRAKPPPDGVYAYDSYYSHMLTNLAKSTYVVGTTLYAWKPVNAVGYLVGPKGPPPPPRNIGDEEFKNFIENNTERDS